MQQIQHKKKIGPGIVKCWWVGRCSLKVECNHHLIASICGGITWETFNAAEKVCQEILKCIQVNVCIS